MRLSLRGPFGRMGLSRTQREPSEEIPETPLDVAELEKALRAKVIGEVRFDPGTRAIYSTDGSNYRQVPIGAVIPRSVYDVVQTVRICREFGAPVLSRGGGTSLAGQTCNVAVVMDLSKYFNRVLKIDEARHIAVVEAGLVLDHLQQAANPKGLLFGPDPATHNRCTLGGMIGNNSCGAHAQMAGPVVNNVESLDILTYEGLRMVVGPTPPDELERLMAEPGPRGEIYRKLKALIDRVEPLVRQRFPSLVRRVSGYNLDQLLPEKGFNVARALVGTEGTCVTILHATVRLVPKPKARSLVMLGYPTIYHAADHVPEVDRHHPIALEGIDDLLVELMQRKGLHTEDLSLLPTGRGWLMVEFGGDSRAEVDAKAHALMADLSKGLRPPSMKLYDRDSQESELWKLRESGLGATARVPGDKDHWEGWEDSAVPPENLGKYLRRFRELLDKHNLHTALYGHFGQGCVHCRIDFDFVTKPGIENYRAFVEQAADLVGEHGGSLSGEHGDGQSRGELLPKMFGPELVQAFREFKGIWDPTNKMNPHKVVDPYRVDQNLRLGAGFHPAEPRTHFTFNDDRFSFPYATERCVGVGLCRRTEGGVMCPSYMVTREELHSTRGRAHALFEMMLGDPIRHGWRSEAVREALDLCLSCKGCKSDCPVNVDMATYKAEFLSHYYEGRLRPRHAYAFGLIMLWARLASAAPRLVNLATHAPGLSEWFKSLAEMAPQRTIPKFAPRSFQSLVRHRFRKNAGGPRVILFPDTFNNFFHTDTAGAALEVLERAGCDVVVPPQALCCGRPLYDYGMLNLAKAFLHRTVRQLRSEIRQGTPVVMMEPSCASVFRDELLGLFPNDEDAQRLAAQTMVLSEYLTQHAPGFPWPKLARRAVVQTHCHHHSVLKFKAEKEALHKLGLEAEIPDSGCCGMAGAFGFERDHLEVSRKCGERVILPKVRQAPKDALIIADGFSCREQIAQDTDRWPLHFAQVVQLGLRQVELGRYPERQRIPVREVAPAPRIPPRTWWLLLGAAVLTGGWVLSRQRLASSIS